MSSERARLTALYGGLLVLAGALLVGLVYLLVSEGLYASVLTAVAPAVPSGATDVAIRSGTVAPALPSSDWAQTTIMQPGQYAVARKVSTAAGDAALSQLLTVSGVSLAVYSALSVALAWWMAGRVLRPVGVITARAHAALRQQPARTPRAEGPARRAQGAGRHLRRDARPDRGAGRRPAAVRRQRRPRAAHPARRAEGRGRDRPRRRPAAREGRLDPGQAHRHRHRQRAAHRGTAAPRGFGRGPAAGANGSGWTRPRPR